MCGIVALSRAPRSSIPYTRQFAMSALLSIESRGRHATGLAWTRGKRKVIWHANQRGPARRVAWDLPIDRTIRVHAFMGHTRHATLGSPRISENNHPVVNEHLVLVHNGRVDNHEELIDLAGVERIGEVDSFALAALLSRQHELGASHPTELLELVEGCAAVAWMDANDTEVLHLARLTQRPMTIGFTNRGDLVMTSTPQNMRMLSRMSKVDIGDIASLEEGTYLAVRDGKIIEWSNFEPRQSAVIVPEDVPGMPSQPALPQMRGFAHGITDMFDDLDHDDADAVIDSLMNQDEAADNWEEQAIKRDGEGPPDWWDETEELLGMSRHEIDRSDKDNVVVLSHDEWLSGREIVKRRPKNKHGW